jgi:hypothetical protein
MSEFYKTVASLQEGDTGTRERSDGEISGMFDTDDACRARLQARLILRRDELEEEVLARVLCVADPTDESTLERAATAHGVGLAIEFAIETVVESQLRSVPPPQLLAVVRSAAHDGVQRNTVIRRYLAGQAVFIDFLVEEAEAVGLDGVQMETMLQRQSANVERLLALIGREYDRAKDGLPTIELDRLETLRRMLAGESVDTSGIAYDFGAEHLGVVAAGTEARHAVRALAARLDCVLLSVEVADEEIWAWLGGRRASDPRELDQGGPTLPGVRLAFGEPAGGLSGWRLTHLQAWAAMAVTRRASTATTHYSDVALLTAIAKDEILANSLRRIYLAPLQKGRDGGETALATLRAYFSTGRNVSSTAAVLGVSRRTVMNRLQAIEGLLGRYLSTCAAEMEAALRLEDFEGDMRATD